MKNIFARATLVLAFSLLGCGASDDVQPFKDGDPPMSPGGSTSEPRTVCEAFCEGVSLCADVYDPTRCAPACTENCYSGERTCLEVCVDECELQRTRAGENCLSRIDAFYQCGSQIENVCASEDTVHNVNGLCSSELGEYYECYFPDDDQAED